MPIIPQTQVEYIVMVSSENKNNECILRVYDEVEAHRQARHHINILPD